MKKNYYTTNKIKRSYYQIVLLKGGPQKPFKYKAPFTKAIPVHLPEDQPVWPQHEAQVCDHQDGVAVVGAVEAGRTDIDGVAAKHTLGPAEQTNC